MRSIPLHARLVGAALLAALVACQGPSTTAREAPAADAPAPSSARAVASSDLERLVELATTDNRVEQHARHLCLEIGPRLTSSHGLQRSLEWAREQFESWGLEARLEAWGEFPVGFDRGPWSGAIVAPERIELECNTMAWTAGTGGPRRGSAVLYPTSQDELDALRDRLAGAWIVAPTLPRDQRPAKELRDAIDAAFRDAPIAGRVRRPSGRNASLLHTTGSWKIEWDSLPTEPQVQVRGDQFDAIVERLKAGEPVELEFDVDNRFYRGPVTQYNVVADLKGVEKPDEVVIVSGHLDSWDGAQGAQDNATGCATTMEAARLIAASGARPKRTIRFCLWTGEEQGLFGSEGYVRDHAGELERTSAAFVHDGGTNYVSGLRCTPEMESDLRAAFAPAVALDPTMPFEIETGDGLTNSGDSDHAPFISAGVPAFFWRQTGDSDYRRVHHTQHDTFDTIVPEYQRRSAAVIAIGALGVANLDGLLSRENMEPIEPRRIGVQLDGATITSVTENGKAAACGLREGDQIVSIDGMPIASREDLSRALQQGPPVKRLTYRRGEQTLECELDWSDSQSEKRRAEREARRAQADDGAPRR